MKNLFLTPTDKPSMLILDKEDNTYLPLQDEPVFMEHQDLVENQNIYITSDEKAKEGDWGYIPFQGGNVKLVGKYFADDWKKIILTTDGDLIKDGVQEIDNEFLEWFVKNPSCEEVEVADYVNVLFDDKVFHMYKIIIPIEPQQETLEEAALNYSKQFLSAEDSLPQWDFKKGAEWQAEKMYSEEEVLEIFSEWFCYQIDEDVEIKLSFQQWFNKFKK
jgi:hypothetical protein